MFNRVLTQYYLQDNLLLSADLTMFYEANKDLPEKEFESKLEAQFGFGLKHISRMKRDKYLKSISDSLINNDNYLKSISTSLMWVRVFVILSLASGIAYALLLLFYF